MHHQNVEEALKKKEGLTKEEEEILKEEGLTTEEIEAYQKARSEAFGQNSAEYTNKMDWLKRRWDFKMDTIPSRKIGFLLMDSLLDPISCAIVSDNLEYFHTNYKGKVELKHALMTACFCGSRKIAEFLLDKLGIGYLSLGCEFIFSNISGSMNTKWIEDVAHIMYQAGKERPLIFAEGETFEMIYKIFKGELKKSPLQSNNLGDNASF